MKYIPTLTIAGSDSSGGAGIQADIKAMSALGCYAMSVITAITAQNTQGVRAVEPISLELIEAQLQAVLEDIPPKVIKIGMLFDASIIRTVAKVLRSYADTSSLPPIVLDPVMVATSGDPLLRSDAVVALTEELMPLATLLTPNLPEAEVLSGVHPIRTKEDADSAAIVLFEKGAKAVLIKGGHSMDSEAMDLLYTAPHLRKEFTAPMIETPNTHGTGCTLSSAIAALLAQGYSLEEAVGEAKRYLTDALLSGQNLQIGKGHGPVDHFYHPKASIKVCGERE